MVSKDALHAETTANMRPEMKKNPEINWWWCGGVQINIARRRQEEERIN